MKPLKFGPGGKPPTREQLNVQARATAAAARAKALAAATCRADRRLRRFD